MRSGLTRITGLDQSINLLPRWRITRMKVCFSWLAGMLVASQLMAREAIDRPNVILIYLDDSGYGDYAHHGNPVIETPNITRMAEQGVNFTQFHVTSPACSASRYSLLTGRYPMRSGLGVWVVGPNSKAHLRAEEVTLAEALQQRGYATGIFGKWHLGNPNAKNQMSPHSLPLAHGFDEWLGTNVSHDYVDAQLLQSDPAGQEPIPGYKVVAKNLQSKKDLSDSLTKRYTDAAIDFISRHKDKPFFSYIAYNQPHLALHVDAAYRGKSRRGLLGDVMAEIDDSIGRILQSIETAGLRENTLVIFSSDNGPWIRFQNSANDPKYGEARLHIGYAQPFRDGKGSNWEGGHRVPGIFYWPGMIRAKRQLEPVSTMDVMPTVMALCGAATQREIDGRDIRPLLMPGRFSQAVAPFALLYSGAANEANAYREGPWKLHVRLISQTGDSYGFRASPQQPLLFQVEHDLGERYDRAAEQPERVKAMLQRMQALESSLR